MALVSLGKEEAVAEIVERSEGRLGFGGDDAE